MIILKQNYNIQVPLTQVGGTIIAAQIESVSTAQLSQFFTLNFHLINGTKRLGIFLICALETLTFVLQHSKENKDHLTCT